MPKTKKPRAASAGLKRSKLPVNAPGQNPPGVSYVEVLDGLLFVERKQAREFRIALKELCKQYDYKFVEADYL